MIIVTTNDLPGFQVTEILGEVFGLTVRAHKIVSQISATLKTLAGGEPEGLAKSLIASRHKAIARMAAEAEAKGANAILAMRFDTSETGDLGTAITAYGTAVTAEKL